MSEHDVPAERDERDELRRNFAAWLDEWRFCPACDVQLQRSTGTEFVPTWHRHEDDCVLAGILSLLAALGAPAPAEAAPRGSHGKERVMRYRCKPDFFAATYEPADAPASGEPSGAEAAVREAPPISDTAVARIIEADAAWNRRAAHQERDADARRLDWLLLDSQPDAIGELDLWERVDAEDDDECWSQYLRAARAAIDAATEDLEGGSDG